MEDSEQLRAAAIKKARREIIGVLNTLYSMGPFGFPDLCMALTHLELPDDECVRRDLIYLCEKGYVRWTNKKPFTPWAKRMYKLTATGNEVAEKIASDPALEP